MIRWPDSLVEELASKRALIFLGAGISASSVSFDGIKRTPTWKDLLRDACDEFHLSSDDKEYVLSLIESDMLLDAAEIIFHNIDQPTRRTFFQNTFAAPRYQPSAFHHAIRKINPKIVITTNYDQIYEQACDALIVGQGFSVKMYDDEKILNDIRSKDNLIIKAHGCVSKTEGIILTRSEYFRIKRENSQFYNVLNSLLTVNTVVFLGYGMSDPDIQLILENTNISAPSDHPHYLVMPEGRHSALKKAMENAYNLKILEYNVVNDDHSDLLRSLEELVAAIDDKRPLLVS